MWGLQLILFVALFAIRITDIIAIFKVFIGLFKRKKPAVAGVESGVEEVDEPVKELMEERQAVLEENEAAGEGAAQNDVAEGKD